MAWVVFLRGANVGGARRFLPSAFAKELPELGLVNLGAAGTFVARAEVSERRLRSAIAARLPFSTDLLVCPGSEIQELVQSAPFPTVPPTAKPCLTVLAAPAATQLSLPFFVPSATAWEVQVLAVRGRYVLSLYRRQGQRLTYPNPVLEKELGVGATTRGWSTVVALDRILRNPGRPGRPGYAGGK